jgi:hypothetical protein
MLANSSVHTASAIAGYVSRLLALNDHFIGVAITGTAGDHIPSP